MLLATISMLHNRFACVSRSTTHLCLQFDSTHLPLQHHPMVLHLRCLHGQDQQSPSLAHLRTEASVEVTTAAVQTRSPRNSAFRVRQARLCVCCGRATI